MSSSLELPSLPRDQDSYGQFKDALIAIHAIAAPEHDPGFSVGGMRHANADGSYFYFPHPDDREEILSFARELSVDADTPQRTLIVPVGILAAHPFQGSGRTSRVYHAMLAGKSAAEIEAMEICGSRFWFGTDEQAHMIIDLRPPAALLPHIENHAYEGAGVQKQASLRPDFAILGRSAREYIELRDCLPEDHQRDLDESLVISPFNQDLYVRLDDPASFEFALSAQDQSVGNEDESAGVESLVTALSSLDEAGLTRFVDDLWRFRRLRALANIACIGSTMLGSREISTPDHERSLAIASQYVRLTNNLVSD